MEFKGTKGKFTYRNIPKEWFDIVDEKGYNVLYSINKENEELKANALLISKSPEMLEMLRKINNKLKGNGFPMLQSEIEKLIKEATEL